MYIIVGLGNPGEEYEMTHHNTGRMIVENLAKNQEFPEWAEDKKLNAFRAEGKIGGQSGGKAILLLPNTFMNNSGDCVAKIISSKAKAKNLIVVHDDLDLPLGKFKISFGRGSAGHRGVESIIKKIKTNEFIRIRVGICPKKPARNASRPPAAMQQLRAGSEAGGKPGSAKEIIKLLMAKFFPEELPVFKKTAKKIISAIEMICGEGLEKSMSSYN